VAEEVVVAVEVVMQEEMLPRLPSKWKKRLKRPRLP
jgi:hypothetical protein